MFEVQRIIDWLHTYGKTNEPSKHFTVTDEPWEQMSVEWQDWSFAAPGLAMLFVGYWYEANGDLVPDPNIVIDLEEGRIIRTAVVTMFGTHQCECAADLDFVKEFLHTVFERHLAPRQHTGSARTEQT